MDFAGPIRQVAPTQKDHTVVSATKDTNSTLPITDPDASVSFHDLILH